jgi:subtilisin-like proprotein convertase family protein
MNGSSAAVPIVSGSVALLLEKNPNLTWRDIKYILAKTAKKIDPNFKGIKIKVNDNLEYLLDQGWITNKAGFSFSNWYGFGVIDVEKALEFAKNYNFKFPKFIEKEWIINTKDVILSNIFGLFQTEINVPKNESLNIESIQIRVSIESQYIGDISLELISPQGTKSIIWHAGNAFTSNGNLEDMQMLSNAFYGEKSYGIWKLNVINIGFHKKNPKFKQWKLKVSGH